LTFQKNHLSSKNQNIFWRSCLSIFFEFFFFGIWIKAGVKLRSWQFTKREIGNSSNKSTRLQKIEILLYLEFSFKLPILYYKFSSKAILKIQENFVYSRTFLTSQNFQLIYQSDWFQRFQNFFLWGQIFNSLYFFFHKNLSAKKKE